MSHNRPELARIRAGQLLETRRHEDADNSLRDQPPPGASAPRTSYRIYPQLGRAITQSQIADVRYWLSAFAITATVTFLYKH